jgi:phosphate-selective porin
MAKHSPKIFMLLFFSLVLLAIATFPCEASDGDLGGDWEERFKALESRMGELESENRGLKEEVKSLKAQRESQVAPASSTADNATALEERVTKIEKGLSKNVLVGTGSLKITGLLQSWYVVDQDANDRFRLRRSELKFGGKIAEEQPIEYTVMIDPAQVTEDATRRSILQDAFFTLGYIPHHTIDIGQYKVGLGEEGTRSSTKIDTIERAYISRTFGDQRDIGLRLSGKWPYVDYNVGIFNGSGMNQADANDQKDIAGRMVLKPFKDSEKLKGLEMGISGYHRPTHGNTFPKKRLGFESRYEYKKLSIKGEYMSGQGTAASTSTTENRTLANGWYGQLGYYFVPKLQGVLKYEQYDPNEQAANDQVQEYTAGLNYFIEKYNAKLQINYIHKDEQKASEVNNDQVIGAIQVAF